MDDALFPYMRHTTYTHNGGHVKYMTGAAYVFVCLKGGLGTIRLLPENGFLVALSSQASSSNLGFSSEKDFSSFDRNCSSQILEKVYKRCRYRGSRVERLEGINSLSSPSGRTTTKETTRKERETRMYRRIEKIGEEWRLTDVAAEFTKRKDARRVRRALELLDEVERKERIEALKREAESLAFELRPRFMSWTERRDRLKREAAEHQIALRDIACDRPVDDQSIESPEFLADLQEFMAEG